MKLQKNVRDIEKSAVSSRGRSENLSNNAVHGPTLDICKHDRYNLSAEPKRIMEFNQDYCEGSGCTKS